MVNKAELNQLADRFHKAGLLREDRDVDLDRHYEMQLLINHGDGCEN